MNTLRYLPILSYQSLSSIPIKPLSLLLSSCSSSSSCSSNKTEHVNLSPKQLTEINLLIPRLCQSNHLKEATHLISTALLTNPPLKSLSISILIHRLSVEPNMTHTMYLLNHLKHNSDGHPSLKTISKHFISSYLNNGKPKEAVKVFNWLSREDSPCAPLDPPIYSLMVNGLCKKGLSLEGLRIFRAMVGADFVPGTDLVNLVYRGLLREAMIEEARELSGALLGSVGIGNDPALKKKVMGLLDQLIAEWVD